MNLRRFREVGHEPSHAIDLAPMLDFVINLLIFFIITAVFIREAGVQVARPNADPSTSPKSAKGVEILADGEIRLEGKPVDLRAVRANVERIRAAEPNRGLLIIAHDDSPTGVLVAVVDEIHLGGIHDLTFSTAKN